MHYQNIQFHYFTGTGNAAKVCEWMAATAKTHEVSTHTIRITESHQFPENIQPNTLLVFASPTHGFNFPPIMLSYLWKYPRGKNHVAIINTRAGMLLGNFVTPGLSGVALYLAAFILWLKGYKIRAMHPVDMPSNWISVHPGLNLPTIKKLHQYNKVKVEKLANTLLLGKSNFRALYDIVQDVLISPISLLYYLMGRFILAKTFYASGDCTNCGLCYKKCPVHAIKVIDNRPFWTIHCESCMKCMSNCPHRAIETSHGFTFLFFYLFYAFVMVVIYAGISAIGINIANPWIEFVLESILGIVLFSLAYFIMHFLMRFKLVQLIMMYTSLTHFKFWGPRYKALK